MIDSENNFEYTKVTLVVKVGGDPATEVTPFGLN